MMQFNRAWAMPNHETFSIKPIKEFVNKYLKDSKSSVDPFSRDKLLATYCNDLNPNTLAPYHMDAKDFCMRLFWEGVKVDLVLFDPPYSPRQISEMYKSIGKTVTMKDTQSAVLYSTARNAANNLLIKGGICLSFGWSTNGMGKSRGYEIEEILLVAHGGAHNDTICMAERKL